MIRICVAVIGFLGVLASSAFAQNANAVVANAAKAMGVETLTSIRYFGVAQNGSLGQNNHPDQPWPMVNASDYSRAIDFTQPASRATWVTYAQPTAGGPSVPGQGQQNITSQNTAWAQQQLGPHSDGLVVGYLPKERILIYGDMFNPPPASGSCQCTR